MSKLISQIEISRESVTFSELDKIGEGAFGRVYKGKEFFPSFAYTQGDEREGEGDP